MDNVADSEQAIADATATVMLANDHCTKALGMQIEAVAPGYARLSMQVHEEFLNGHQTCHGGMIFSLADSAFAFACNSRNLRTVAGGCSIEFLRPAYRGQRLTAEAKEQASFGRQGVYDVSIKNEAGESVALFRGKSIQIKGEVTSTDGSAASPTHVRD